MVAATGEALVAEQRDGAGSIWDGAGSIYNKLIDGLGRGQGPYIINQLMASDGGRVHVYIN